MVAAIIVDIQIFKRFQNVVNLIDSADFIHTTIVVEVNGAFTQVKKLSS